MTIEEIVNDTLKRRQVRQFTSLCCGEPVSLVYQNITTTRRAIVVACTKCDRFFAFDSRDDGENR